jgi:hypothetical protein
MKAMVSLGKAALLTTCVATAVGGIAFTRKPEPMTTLDLVKDFHSWKKANPEPVRLFSSFDTLCRGISPQEIKAHESKDPHFQRVITVYVNKPGEKAMMNGGKFPIGSIVVKEKSNEVNKKVVLSTVMIKREKGYNPTCGDWQFAALNADATKTDGDGKLESCMKCHQDQAKRDFVYRTYVGQKGRAGVSGYDPFGKVGG